MLKVLSVTLDFIFPKSGLQKTLSAITADEFLRRAGGLQSQNNNHFSYLLKYKNKFVRDSVWALKYKGNKDVARIFAELLYDYLIEEVADTSMFGIDDKPIIVPVPISKEHFRERGWNHVELVIKELEKLDKENFDYDYSSLKKIKNTVSQTKTKSKTEREKNIIGSLDVKDSHGFLNKHIILIDDVVTTGSTLREAKKILKEAGGKQILVVAIAH